MRWARQLLVRCQLGQDPGTSAAEMEDHRGLQRRAGVPLAMVPPPPCSQARAGLLLLPRVSVPATLNPANEGPAGMWLDGVRKRPRDRGTGTPRGAQRNTGRGIESQREAGSRGRRSSGFQRRRGWGRQRPRKRDTDLGVSEIQKETETPALQPAPQDIHEKHPSLLQHPEPPSCFLPLPCLPTWGRIPGAPQPFPHMLKESVLARWHAGVGCPTCL